MTNKLSDWQMFTEAGNVAIHESMLSVVDSIETGYVTRTELPAAVRLAMKQVAKTHPEVHDTEPEWAVVDFLKPVCDRHGWTPISRDDLF